MWYNIKNSKSFEMEMGVCICRRQFMYYYQTILQK